MATIEERVSIVEDAIVRIARHFDTLLDIVSTLNVRVGTLNVTVEALGAKVEKNHQTVMGAIAEANKAQMGMLESMKSLGRSPNY